MKAVRFHRTGGPEVLQYEDAPDPVPGAGEVLVKVHACGVNRIDVWFRSGRYRPRFPHILGTDVSGVISAISPGCENVNIGDEVVLYPVLSDGTCSYCMSGRRNRCARIGLLGGAADGGYAEYVKVPAYNILKKGSLDFETAASLPVVFGTAWNALVSTARVSAGDTVLVWGGGSGLGHAAIQIAKISGARVIATAGNERKLELATELGATDVINHNTEDVVKKVSEITDGEGASIIFDHIGGDNLVRSINMLKKGGMLLSSGITTGEASTLDIARLYRNELRVAGVYAFTREDLVSVLKLAQSGRLKPYIHSVMQLVQAQEAHRVLESRNLFGKIILKP